MERCGVNIKDSQTQTVDTFSLQHQEAQGSCVGTKASLGETDMVPMRGNISRAILLTLASYTRQMIAACTGPADCVTEVALHRTSGLDQLMPTLLWERCPLQNRFNPPPKEGVMPGHSGKADVLGKGKSQRLYLHQILCD